MKEDHYKKVRMRILASMVLVPLIPFIAASIVGFNFFTDSIRTTTSASLQRIVNDHAHMIESFLAERKTDLQFVADTFSFNDISDQQTLDLIFGNLQKKSNAFVDLGVFDDRGLHVAYHGQFQLAGKPYGETEWFKEVMKSGYYISDIFLGYRKIPHFVIALTKRDADGRLWVIRATIDSLIFSEVVEKVRIGRTGEAYILNTDGILQTQRRSGGELMERDPRAKDYLTPHEGVRIFIPENGSDGAYLYGTTWMKEGSWLLVVRRDKADAFAALRSASLTVILITVVGIAVIILLAVYISNRVIRTLERADREKSQLSQQLILAGRLAEIGEMSSGIAHEINNPLQIIRAEQTLIDMILAEFKERPEFRDLADLDEVLDSVNQIKVQVDRCGEITQGLLKFARQKETKPTRVDLRELVPDVVRMIAKKAEVEGIGIRQEIPEALPAVNADPSQLQQVLLNFLNNAIYAIGERHGASGLGELTVRLTADDHSVAIDVQDNGAGISKENMEKIFTPFFTTKPVGKGTGLGLSICFGIIDKMGGVIQVGSEKNVGTTFSIRLPLKT